MDKSQSWMIVMDNFSPSDLATYNSSNVLKPTILVLKWIHFVGWLHREFVQF